MSGVITFSFLFYIFGSEAVHGCAAMQGYIRLCRAVLGCAGYAGLCWLCWAMQAVLAVPAVLLCRALLGSVYKEPVP